MRLAVEKIQRGLFFLVYLFYLCTQVKFFHFEIKGRAQVTVPSFCFSAILPKLARSLPEVCRSLQEVGRSGQKLSRSCPPPPNFSVGDFRMRNFALGKRRWPPDIPHMFNFNINNNEQKDFSKQRNTGNV